MKREIIHEKKLGLYTIRLERLPWQLIVHPAYFEDRWRVVVLKMDFIGSSTSVVDMTSPVMTLAEGEEAYQRICTEYAVALARSVLGV